MDEIEQMAEQLERMMGDPIGTSVRGLVHIVSASEPEGRGRYQECQLELMTDAAGVPQTLVRTSVVTTRKTWPKVGGTLPARISTINPQRVDVDWEALAR